MSETLSPHLVCCLRITVDAAECIFEHLTAIVRTTYQHARALSDALKDDVLPFLSVLSVIFCPAQHSFAAIMILGLTLVDFHVDQPLCNVLTFAGAMDLLGGPSLVSCSIASWRA